ncbi:MAG: NAD(P)H-dependent oxidoreductase [Gammaproteobacteria bacterium]|nr:NAD(P)H-dependent oxidoreductase [Gammaproteobacteria bacterium]
MNRPVVVIDGHPDPAADRLCHALADAYVKGAESAGHPVEIVRLADLDIPFLRTADDFNNQQPGPEIRRVQDAIESAGHIVLVYPLWLGTMPAMLKAFIEQLFRPGFAFGGEGEKSMWSGRLKGRSARVVVTMGMPAFVYRWFFRAHSLKSLERNILKFCGIKPVRETLLGMVDSASDEKRGRWLRTMHELGRRMR